MKICTIHNHAQEHTHTFKHTNAQNLLFTECATAVQTYQYFSMVGLDSGQQVKLIKSNLAH